MTEFNNKKNNFSPKNTETVKTNNKDENNKTIAIAGENQKMTTESEKLNTANNINKDTSKENANKEDKNKRKEEVEDTILKNPVATPIWLSISEASKIGGITAKTIRRAIQSESVKYKIYKNRYLVGLRSLVVFLNSNTKLKNKLRFNGIGQYIKEWRK